MTLSQSAVSDLLDAFRAGDGVDLIRESVRLVLQELIETEADRDDRRRPLRTLRRPHRRTQRSPAAPVGHPGRRRRVGRSRSCAKAASSRRSSSPGGVSTRRSTRW